MLGPEELADALRARGLTVSVAGAELTVSPRVGRLDLRAYLDEKVTVKDGRAYWSWGAPVMGDSADEMAETVYSIMSLPPDGWLHNSA